MVVNVFREHKISAIHDFYSRFYLSFHKPRKYLKLSWSKNFKKLAFQGIPVYSKNFWTTWNYMAVNAPQEHKISIVHDFFSGLSFLL